MTMNRMLAILRPCETTADLEAVDPDVLRDMGESLVIYGFPLPSPVADRVDVQFLRRRGYTLRTPATDGTFDFVHTAAHKFKK